MAVLLATLSALVYGTADFCGGVATRRNDGAVVTVLSQLAGCALIAVALVAWGPVTVTANDAVAGLLAGVGGGLGLVCFYPALAAGPMSVVAPTTAVCSAIVPLVYGLISGERPSPAALCGAVLALPAIVLVARESGSHGTTAPRTVSLSVAAGFGFGLFFIALSHASSDAGMWPLAFARVASIGLIGSFCVVSRRRFHLAPGTTPITIVTGALDVTANGLYLLAAGTGLLSVVAVLGSLYPASTVVLAMIVLHERLARAQMVGIVVACTAVTLIALGS
jgi:uncharacterized membrane protein